MGGNLRTRLEFINILGKVELSKIGWEAWTRTRIVSSRG